ncbi:unnamed protein product [Caenorhabditis angaria]|uniref:Uncharacterized protein n=1 Tax=Caenorhabditis angaria TaxID=860376 RepID=A0A9P1IP41_9PELO|nr:unnamed protein product [Caenorhabditis angaria]
MPKHTYYFFTFWTFWLIFTVYLAQNPFYSGNQVPWDNCDQTKQWEPPTRSYINKEQYLSEKAKVRQWRARNQFFRDNNFTRIDYGTTELVYCKNTEKEQISCDFSTKTAIINPIQTSSIKSILRTVELDPYVASALRFVILETLSFRMTFSIIRTSDVLINRPVLPRVIQFLFSISTYVVCLQGISLFAVTVLHSAFDKPIKVAHPYCYLFLGIFTFLEMLIDLLHDSVDIRTHPMKSPKFYLKSLFFVFFCLAFPRVVMNWIEFFEHKNCHAYVSLFDGILEYLCAFSIIIFTLSNTLMNVQMYITPSIQDIDYSSPYPKEVYYPAFKEEKSPIYESLNNLNK